MTSIDQMRTALRGRWGLCGQPGLFNLPWPGIQINDTGDHWNFLTWSDGNGLAREYGVEVEGPISYGQPAVGAPIAAGFTLLPTGDTLISTPSIGDDPRVMTLQQVGGAAIRYVALPPVTYELPPDAAVDGGGEIVDAPVDGEAGTPADASGSVPCSVHLDCPPGYMCFNEARITACPTQPTGVCVRLLSENCLAGLYSHCSCVQTHNMCAQFVGSECQEVTAGTDSYFGCTASSPDAP